jgi:hypothetical protein
MTLYPLSYTRRTDNARKSFQKGDNFIKKPAVNSAPKGPSLVLEKFIQMRYDYTQQGGSYDGYTRSLISF